MSNSLVFLKKTQSYLILTASSPVDLESRFPKWEKWAQVYTDTFQTLLNIGVSVTHLCTSCFRRGCGIMQGIDSFNLGNIL